MGQHHPRRTVLQHVGKALGRVIRIQRNIGASCLQHRQQPDHHGESTFGTQGDALVRAHAQRAQVMCQLIGLLVQACVVQRVRAMHQCRRLRRALHLRFEKNLQAVALRCWPVECLATFHGFELRFPLHVSSAPPIAFHCTVQRIKATDSANVPSGQPFSCGWQPWGWRTPATARKSLAAAGANGHASGRRCGHNQASTRRKPAWIQWPRPTLSGVVLHG